MVALRTGEPEHALLEDGIGSVPEGNRETELVPDVGQTGHPVFIPPVGTGPSVIMREVAPGVTVVAVVFAHCPPRALGQVRTPLVPGVRVEQVVLGPPCGVRQAGVPAVDVDAVSATVPPVTRARPRHARPETAPSREQAHHFACVQRDPHTHPSEVTTLVRCRAVRTTHSAGW